MAEEKKDLDPNQGNLEEESTEVTENTIDNPDALSEEDNRSTQKPEPVEKEKQTLGKRLAGFFRNLNIYLIAFIVTLLVGLLVVFVSTREENAANTIDLEGQELSQDALDDLLQNDTSFGDVSQTLTVEANAIFNGKILVKDDLDVAGSISVGGPLALPGITVSGSSEFDDVAINNNLSILGNASVNGALTSSSLSVSGNGTFGGDLSASKLDVDFLQFTNDLELLKHIDTGGSSPNISKGNNLGGGGTVSISGTDTAGSATINTGGSPNSGILADITFVDGFGRTPHVQITPVGSATGSLEFYITRNTNGFSIGSASSPSSSTTYIFDYWAVE